MNQEKEKWKKLNNAGSTIVSVIVVIAFVSILATTLLYISGMNYYMKITDQKTKESFYEAETALEEIKAALNAEVADASEKAYIDVMINYAVSDGYTRYSNFQHTFFSYLETSWNKRTDSGDPSNPFTYEQVIQSVVESKYATAITLDPLNPDAGKIVHLNTDGYAQLKGVKLTYTDSKGYTTMISTDYIITVPDINWGVDATKTSWSPGDSVEREKVDLTGYVNYSSWTKQ
ncbi:MAG TPA: hypothetical protein VJY54_13860 [Lachnospiraceae bacterium]|nr:hypothetical protein [Lachnospiraceae bacterium]